MTENINTQSMLRVGTILHGTYRIDSYLSSGGFGNTYVVTNQAFDETFGELVVENVEKVVYS